MTRDDILRQMIEEYRKKLDTYQAMIGEWEKELGGPSELVSAVDSQASDRKKAVSGDPLSVVKEWQFFKAKSQPEAAKMLLELVGHPLKTSQIIEGIEKGGIKVGGKTAKDKKTNFYTILHRGDDFRLMERVKDTWGLKGWPGVKKEKGGEDEKSTENGKENESE